MITSFVHVIVRGESVEERASSRPSSLLAAPDGERVGLGMSTNQGNGSGPVFEAEPLGHDYTLSECDLEPLQALVARLEESHSITVRRSPSVCLIMIPAEDSLEQQKFFLGEALTTECEVSVDGLVGYGLCLGDEPVRAYCIAVVDALLYGVGPVPHELEAFLEEHARIVSRRDQDEFDLILQTKVDFKLMEEE
jgi:phosphonate C-P lyase system protein PhnG